MIVASLHNPDRYMSELRQVLSQDRKRIGILIGAGAPASVKTDDAGNLVINGENPLIPDISGLTRAVIDALKTTDQEAIETLKSEFDELDNVEAILTQIRKLAQAIGDARVYGLSGQDYEILGQRICQAIGDIVSVHLPVGRNPFSNLVAWVSGTQREHSVEIFTPNYDLLIEEAFERDRVAYFDGFTGSHLPFFDPASVSFDPTGSSNDPLPSRWSRLWKLHGSLGWKIVDDSVVRTGQRDATELIYPDHLKYDQVTKHPYSAMFERLRWFLMTPDTLLICSGFSFADAHICAVMHEALAANKHTAIFAFQYRTLENEQSATTLAFSRPNVSVYAPDGAIVNGVVGNWRPGEPPNEEWREIRKTYWDERTSQFTLGDFAQLSDFLALTQAQNLSFPPNVVDDNDESVEDQ